MPDDRQQILEQTSRKLIDAAPQLKSIRAMIGLDGFVDEIIAVVDRRHDQQRFEPMRTIDEFGRRIQRAAGASSNYELVVKQMKLGGNGPIMANALASVGFDVTYVGNLGYPAIHPVFEEFTRRATVMSIGEPAHTDALEFEDGKVMLGKLTPLNEANWENLITRVGKEKLIELITGSRLVGMVNWTMMPNLTDIWGNLLEQVMPHVPRSDERKMFIDLTDPEKRNPDDLRSALKLLSRYHEQVEVILGLNLKEATQVSDVLGLPAQEDAESAAEELAVQIRRTLDLSCVIVHPRKGASAATRDQAATFAGPFTRQPKISTGAGDHFNAGFCVGLMLDFTLEESLCTGVATSGYYVRHAATPTADQLASFIGVLPEPD